MEIETLLSQFHYLLSFTPMASLKSTAFQVIEISSPPGKLESPESSSFNTSPCPQERT